MWELDLLMYIYEGTKQYTYNKYYGGNCDHNHLAINAALE